MKNTSELIFISSDENQYDVQNGTNNGSISSSPSNNRKNEDNRHDIVNSTLCDKQKKSPSNSIGNNRSDFEFLSVLGNGCIGKVFYAFDKKSRNNYAVKVIQKLKIKSDTERSRVFAERYILKNLKHPNIVKLFKTFQDNESLYFILEVAGIINLHDFIIKFNTVDRKFKIVRFFAAEIVNILVYLRSKDVVHGDFKPDNLMVNDTGNLKLVDFDRSVIINSFEEIHSEERSKLDTEINFQDNNSQFDIKKKSQILSVAVGSFCFSAPEVLLDSRPLSFASDLWSFGCILYFMLTSKLPFKSCSKSSTIQNILSANLTYPKDFPEGAKDLVAKLTNLIPHERIGFDDVYQLQKHRFFDGVDFDDLHQFPSPACFSLQPAETGENTDSASTEITDGMQNDLESIDFTPALGEKFSVMKAIFKGQ